MFPRHRFKKSESQDWSSNRGQAHTRFKGGTHENHTERNETSYGIQEREREKERYLDLVGRWWFWRERECVRKWWEHVHIRKWGSCRLTAGRFCSANLMLCLGLLISCSLSLSAGMRSFSQAIFSVRASFHFFICCLQVVICPWAIMYGLKREGCVVLSSLSVFSQSQKASGWVWYCFGVMVVVCFYNLVC